MNTIHCPSCKRGLQAPDESGDHLVLCPMCEVPFWVVFEDGVVHTVPPEPDPSELSLIAHEPKPSALLPVIDSNVFEDEGARRTVRIHAAFKVGFLLASTCFAFVLFSEKSLDPSEIVLFLPVIGIASLLIAGGFGLVVGNLISYKSESSMRGEEVLRRMREAEEPAARPADYERTDESADDRPEPPRTSLRGSSDVDGSVLVRRPYNEGESPPPTGQEKFE